MCNLQVLLALFLDNFTCWLSYPWCLMTCPGKLGPPHSGFYLLSTALFMVEIDDAKSPECCSFCIIWSLAQLWYLIGTWPNGFMQSDNNSPDYLHWAHAGEKNNSRIQETLSASDSKLVSTDLILVHVIKGKWIVCLSLLWMLLLSPYPKLHNHISENAGVSCCFPGMEMDSKTTCIASVGPF